MNEFRRLVENWDSPLIENIQMNHNADIHHALDFPSQSHHVDTGHLIKHENTNKSVLDRAVEHHDPKIRLAAMQSQSRHLSANHINVGIKDTNPLVRKQAIYSSVNRNVDHAHILHNVLKHGDTETKHTAMTSLVQHLDKSHIDTASQDENHGIRHLAALSHVASPKHIMDHINDSRTSEHDKIDTIKKSNINHDGLSKLMGHSNQNIANAANDRYKKMYG